jgi:hypothetical protein
MTSGRATITYWPGFEGLHDAEEDILLLLWHGLALPIVGIMTQISDTQLFIILAVSGQGKELSG